MKDSQIDWLKEYPDGGHTASAWWGCTPAGPECTHCYAAALAKRFHGIEYRKGGERRKIVSFARNALLMNSAAHCHGKRPLVFWSISDPFDDQVPAEWLSEALNTVWGTLALRWIWLTKRPENIILRLRAADFRDCMGGPGSLANLPNLSIGISAGTQKTLNERLPQLLRLPVHPHAWRVLSLEPMLERINLPSVCPVDWVIVGGESGPGARPCHPLWVDIVVESCRAQMIPVFVKQLGSFYAKAHGLKHPKGADPNEWPEHLRVREFPHIA